MLEVIAFIAGVHLTIMLIAACYRVIDLWYRISEYALSIATRLTILIAINAAAYVFLPADTGTSFMFGQLFFVAFHICIYWLGISLIRFRD